MSELTPDIRNNDSSQDNAAFFRSLAQEYIAEPYPSGSLPVKAAGKTALRELKRAGHKWERNPGRRGMGRFCEWLNDNYHCWSGKEQPADRIKYADQQPVLTNGWRPACFKKACPQNRGAGADEFDKLIETVQRCVR